MSPSSGPLVISLTLFLAVVGLVTSQNSGDLALQCPDIPVVVTTLEFPEPPSSFEALIQVKDPKSTTQLLEYIDKSVRKHAIMAYHLAEYMTLIDDAELGYRFTIRNNICQSTVLTLRDYDQKKFVISPNNMGIISFSEVLHVKYFVSAGGYIGSGPMIGGVATEHWRYCIHAKPFSDYAVADYYLSRKSSVFGHQRVPLKVKFTSTSSKVLNESQTLTYNIVDYKEGAVKDVEVFQVPAGVHCDHDGTREKRLPPFPDQFSLHVEIIREKDKTLTSSWEAFDFPAKLARLDEIPEADSFLGKRFGQKPVIRIFDFNSGHEYVIERITRKCQMYHLSVNDTWPAVKVNGGFVRMQHAFEDLLKSGLLYKGQNMLRGVPVNTWSRRMSSSHIEAYFLTSDWSETSAEYENITTTDILAGILKQTLNPENGAIIESTMYHVYGYHKGHIDINLFDISDCYERGHPNQQLTFRVKGLYHDLVTNDQAIFHNAVQSRIAEAARISRLRVTDIKVLPVVPRFLDITFVLMEKPVIGNVRSPKIGADLSHAIQNLNSSIRSEETFYISVPYRSGIRKVEILQNSLGHMGKFASESSNSQSSIYQYSSGSMAALGICMLLFGCFLGFAVAIVIKKFFNHKIPYRLQ